MRTDSRQSGPFVSGHASEGYEEGTPSITLYDVLPEGGGPCSSGAYPIDRYLTVSVTPEPQDRELSLGEPAAFVSFDGETTCLDVAVSGRLIIGFSRYDFRRPGGEDVGKQSRRKILSAHLPRRMNPVE